MDVMYEEIDEMEILPDLIIWRFKGKEIARFKRVLR